MVECSLYRFKSVLKSFSLAHYRITAFSHFPAGIFI
jgi:hypothetical protein